MSYSDGKTAQYPAAIPTFKTKYDKKDTSVFETVERTVNAGDETHTVPNAAPYAIRLEYIPKYVTDPVTGVPEGLTIAGLTEAAWDSAVSPQAGQFMVSYQNGEVKFNPAQAETQVQPAYTAVGDRAWAEDINQIIREFISLATILGVNPHQGYATVKERIAAIASEIQNARGGFANLDARLDDIVADITPMIGGTWISKEPNDSTGVLGSASLVWELDLHIYPQSLGDITNLVGEVFTIDPATSKLKLKDSQNSPVALTGVEYDREANTVTATHAALVDDVYTAYTEAGIKDALGRTINTASQNFGVGSAIANDKPETTINEVTNVNVFGFTIRGTITDTESDTITRVDVAYSTTNDVNTATIQQLAGADITAFLGAGKTLAVALPGGETVYFWARGVELLSGGGTQVGEWSAVVSEVVTDAAPTWPDADVIHITGTSYDGFTVHWDNVATDPEGGAIVYDVKYRLVGGAWTIPPGGGNLSKSVNDSFAASGLGLVEGSYEVKVTAKDSSDNSTDSEVETFDVLFYELFTGTDGSSPNAAIWDDNATGNVHASANVQIQSNKVRIQNQSTDSNYAWRGIQSDDPEVNISTGKKKISFDITCSPRPSENPPTAKTTLVSISAGKVASNGKQEGDDTSPDTLKIVNWTGGNASSNPRDLRVVVSKYNTGVANDATYNIGTLFTDFTEDTVRHVDVYLDQTNIEVWIDGVQKLAPTAHTLTLSTVYLGCELATNNNTTLQNAYIDNIVVEEAS